MAIDLDLTKLSDAELIDLNRRIVAYLRDKRQRETYLALARFAPGDRVWFRARDGRRIEAVVVRVNKKTVSVHADDHHDWSVSPALLQRVLPRPDSPSNVFELQPR